MRSKNQVYRAMAWVMLLAVILTATPCIPSTWATTQPNSTWSHTIADDDLTFFVYLPMVLKADMVFIPAGEFQMGCDPAHNGGYSCESRELPLHAVYLDAYTIDRYEVTNAQYARFLNVMGNQSEGGATWLDTDDPNARIYQSDGTWQADVGYEDHPVIEVTWYGARAYCQWLGKRLPTEAEWEKAARGTTVRTYPWGDRAPDCTLVNGNNCVGDTTVVGSYPDGASSYGALDMAGNVYEWVNDWYQWDYYSISPYSNPSGPTSCDYKMLRGACWLDYWDDFCVTRRIAVIFPAFSDHVFGFRCADGISEP